MAFHRASGGLRGDRAWAYLLAQWLARFQVA